MFQLVLTVEEYTLFNGLHFEIRLPFEQREHSGSVEECLTRDGGAVGSSLTGVTALWSLSKTHPSLVLVQSRNTCPCLTERLLMGRKESNQTNKQKPFECTFTI